MSYGSPILTVDYHAASQRSAEVYNTHVHIQWFSNRGDLPLRGLLAVSEIFFGSHTWEEAPLGCWWPQMPPNTLRCTGRAFTTLMYNRERERPVLREGRKEEVGKEEEGRERSGEGGREVSGFCV